MECTKLWRLIAMSTSVACLTAGCGGGGDGSPGTGGVAVVTPTPSPTPAPAPAPAPTPTPTPPSLVAAPFPPLNLSTSQVFAVLGYSIAYEYDGPRLVSSQPLNPSEPLVLRYNSAAGGYEAELPRFLPGRLVLNATTGGRGYNVTNGLGSDAPQGVFVNFFPGQISQNQALLYSNYASWGAPFSGPFSGGVVDGYFAFGIPTVPAAIPANGTRTYTIMAEGLTEAFAASTSADYRYLIGSGTLQLDFSGRVMSGTMSLSSQELGREEDFGSVTLSGGAVQSDGSFTGTITVPGLAEVGAFEGRFMGPDASEIIVRWRLPLRIPSAASTAQGFGVWVGKAL